MAEIKMAFFKLSARIRPNFWLAFCEWSCYNKAMIISKFDPVLRNLIREFEYESIEPTFKLPALTFISYVYGWYRPSLNAYLYIGSSGQMRRLQAHNVIGKAEKRLDEDEVHIWPVAEEERTKLEYHLIAGFKPKHQMYGRSGSYAMQKWDIDLSNWRPKNKIVAYFVEKNKK